MYLYEGLRWGGWGATCITWRFTYTRRQCCTYENSSITRCLYEYNLSCSGPVHTYVLQPPPGRSERECRKKGAKSPPSLLSLLRLMIRSIHIKYIQHHASCNPTCRQKLSFGSVPRKKGCILCSTLAAREIIREFKPPCDEIIRRAHAHKTIDA